MQADESTIRPAPKSHLGGMPPFPPLESKEVGTPSQPLNTQPPPPPPLPSSSFEVLEPVGISPLPGPSQLQNQGCQCVQDKSTICQACITSFMTATNATISALYAGLSSIKRRINDQIGSAIPLEPEAEQSLIQPRPIEVANQAMPGLAALIEELKTNPPKLRPLKRRDDDV